VPTGFGVAFAGMILVLLVMAIGYTNNLIYFFVFFTTSICLTTMMVTNANIDRVFVKDVIATDLFMNEEAALEVILHNRKKNSSWGLKLFWSKKDSSTFLVEAPALQDQRTLVSWIPTKRGETSLPLLILESTFPFGLLRSWKRWKSSDAVLVFPERKGQTTFPNLSREAKGVDTTGLFREHRVFQASDSPRRIDWRVAAKQQKLLVKKFEAPEKSLLHFHWDQTRHLPSFEERLSQLALWIDLAEKQGHIYSVNIGSFDAKESQGEDHWRECMEFLARLEPSELS